jgi:2'-5' RNA ligase
MRLFIAVCFPEDVNQHLLRSIDQLKSKTNGNFTKPHNLHITLVFIGETNRVEEIKSAMDEACKNQSPFDLTLNKIGRFERGRSSLVWMSGYSEKLPIIYEKLVKILTSKGFEIEKRKFLPHITLGREVIFHKSKNKEETESFLKSLEFEADTEIDSVVLMSSERTDSGLVYREIYEVS